jgi:CHRD domain
MPTTNAENNPRRSMKKQLTYVSLVIGSLLTLIVLPVSAHNGTRLETDLAGNEEVPVVSTLASGDFEARIVSDTEVSYKFRYTALEGGPILFAHIHLGQKGVNGGIMAFLCNNTAAGPQPQPCPAGPATIQGTIRPADITPIATQQVQAGAFDKFLRALRSGDAYVNLHTTASPGGEIRGQISVDRGRHRGHDRDNDHCDH